MINNDPNMGRKQIFEELPLPSKVKDSENFLSYVYKGVFICVKLLLDIRLNLVKISEGKQISTRHTEVKQPNPVIKNTDKIRLTEGKFNKGGVNDYPTTKRPEPPKGQK